MPDGDQIDGTALAIPSLSLPPADAAATTGWRDDLRLFGYAWAAGFVFFLVMLA